MTDRENRIDDDNSAARKPEDLRNPFERDKDRLLYAPAFRRLAGITQVVAPHEGRTCHNRLIHSLKVAQIGRGIADSLLTRTNCTWDTQALKKILDPDVVESAGLAHDLGHPPFGHAAEKELQELLKGSATDSFEGNAQSFRIVTRLASRTEKERGLNLTRATLRAILKYPWLHSPSRQKESKKWGAYKEDEEHYNFAVDFPKGTKWTESLTKPSPSKSIEAAVMDWADDIAYATHDVEDFYRAGIIPLGQLRNKDNPLWEDIAGWLGEKWIVQLEKEGYKDQAAVDRAISKGRDFLAERLTQSEHPSEGPADWVLSQFISGSIYQAIKTTSVKELHGGLGQRYQLVPNRDVQEAIEVLKELVWFFVIDGPPVRANELGNRRMVRSVYEFFFDEATRFAATGRAQLPHRAISAARKARAEKFPLDANRIACDAVCELTELEVISLHSRLTGSRNMNSDAVGSRW